MANVLVMHDRPDWPPVYVERLKKSGLNVELISRPSECMSRIEKGLGDVDCVLLHKDMGDNVPEEWVFKIKADQIAAAIHNEADHVRLGIVSGEYPDGIKHVLRIGADFYCSPLDLDWATRQLLKGPINPIEKELRGVKILMQSPGSHHER